MKSCCILLFMALSISCEEVIDPELVSVPPIQVIDGWIYPNAAESKITLTETAPFNSKAPNPKVTGALVIVRESSGASNLFRERDEIGVYEPINEAFTIRPFRRYTLEVNVAGTQYTAGINPRITPEIDSLTFRESIGEPDLDDGFYTTLYFQEPSSIQDYYYWEVWQNDVEISRQDINILSDENINGSYIDLELPYAFDEGDTIVVRLHTIAKSAFDYYESVRLLTASGSPAQAIPENPKSNLSSVGGIVNVLGFFNATLPVTDTIILKK